MSDEPENPARRVLRGMDAKLDRALDGLADLRDRVDSPGRSFTNLSHRVGAVEVSVAGLSRRVDHVEACRNRIDRRLDLVCVA